MFDTHFSDLSRETVGQRKARKESKTNGLSRSSSVRSSKSSDSGQSNARPTLLNLFGGGSNKKGSSSRNASHSKLSVLKTSEASKSSRRISSYTVASDSSTPAFAESKNVQKPTTGVLSLSSFDIDADVSSQSEAAESVLSGWTARSSITDSSWGSVLNSPTSKGLFHQMLSPTALTSRNPEASLSPRVSVSLLDKMAQAMQISTAGTIPVQVGDSPTASKRSSTVFDFPVPHFGLPEKSISEEGTESRGKVSSPIQSPSNHLAIPNRPDSWEQSPGWECSPDSKPMNINVPILQRPPFRSSNEKRQKPPRLLHSHLQRSIRRMEAASSKIILERLKEEWREVADASIYRELELEKQRWMLFALRDLKTTRLSGCEDERTIQVSTTGATKVLSLYENHASASFLSALSQPVTEVHHLCKTPLSQKSYPNVRPHTVQEYATVLPYASNSFTSIHAFSLPAQFPASSIPDILKECHRLLTSYPSASPQSTLQSTLHLTIIDPAPLPTTLGPLLRQWLDDHLMFNLERQFRCINPSRLFPIWLQDVGLRAEGSMILTVPFLASVNAQEAEAKLSETDHEAQGSLGVANKTEIIKQELKSVVGRMLWKETWGSFVQARRWWWEEEAIIEECERMRTCWEYSVIDAVREDA